MSTGIPPVFPPLPIDPALPGVLEALTSAGVAVLQAPPGAGKTTRVPLALLGQEKATGVKGRIVVLEPRRLAARAAARRMAFLLGESVGETIGYRVRFENCTGPSTRIEVVTDGLFLRQIQEDPELSGIGAVLFDEFHERRLAGDLLLALCLEARGALRDDLRLLVMSATLDGGPVAALLGGAPMVTSEGRAFPVETRYLPPPSSSGPGVRLENSVAAAVRQALTEEDGDILVFLPGMAEIRRVQARLEGLPRDIILVALHGDLPLDQQDTAIRPAPPGRRKVVLATAIAETSLTIEGVRVVVDAGLMRVAGFDPGSGMSRLETRRLSRAAAEQRRGRAGRTAPGVCYRLWPEAEQRALVPFSPPEILSADLAPLALELAAWGASDPGSLAWLDPPPAAALQQARDLLRLLGGLDAAGGITPHGRAMAALGTHPRLAHLMLRGHEMGVTRLACAVAALLAERDILRGGPGGREADLRPRLDVLLERGGPLPPAADRGAVQAVRQVARQWQRHLESLRRKGSDSGEDTGRGLVGTLVALAYPDRIARRRPGGVSPGGGQPYRLSGGQGAILSPGDPLAVEEWLAVAELDGDRREARIFLAAPVTVAELEEAFAADIVSESRVVWDAREQAVLARRIRRLGALALDDAIWNDPPPEQVAEALLEGVRDAGLLVLPWTPALDAWRQRVMFLRRVEGDAAGWPDLSDAALLQSLGDWLGPHLAGCSRLAHLRRVDLGAALASLLPWPLPQRLDSHAPTHITVPSGSNIYVDYSGDEPVLAVKLQEMFGAVTTPTVAGGRVPVLLHLLSPAQRPVQVTRDLAGFWTGSYRDVRADLRGRYPRHPWPDDPLTAPPTRRARPRGT